MPRVSKGARPPGTWIRTLAHAVLFQTKARTNQQKIVHGGVVQQRTVNLPQGVLEIIIADIGDDIWSLRAVSRTCYSWYIAAVPYLHHTLTLRDRVFYPTRTELKPLAELYKMDLLPFVKKLGILSSSPRPWILPRRFDRRNLLYFSALTNVQQLRIERFNLSKFTSDVERYFGHFAPTLRSISLITSSGTQRQLLCFLALFPNLDDIEIAYYLNAKPSTITKPVPKLAILPSVPSLRGQLKLTCFRKEIMARDMITFFGGLRFQYMDLYGVEGSQLLLEACAGTLQTVRINPIALNKTGNELLRDSDLSCLRSLRSLEVTAYFLSRTHRDAPFLLRDITSTITSPVFSEVVLVFQRSDLYRLSHIPFDVLRQMHSKREFRLVLCLEVPKKYRDYGREVMLRKLNWGLLDFLASRPTFAISERNSWTG